MPGESFMSMPKNFIWKLLRAHTAKATTANGLMSARRHFNFFRTPMSKNVAPSQASESQHQKTQGWCIRSVGTVFKAWAPFVLWEDNKSLCIKKPKWKKYHDCVETCAGSVTSQPLTHPPRQPKKERRPKKAQKQNPIRFISNVHSPLFHAWGSSSSVQLSIQYTLPTKLLWQLAHTVEKWEHFEVNRMS